MALVLESGRQVARSLPVGTLFGVVGGKQSPQSEFIEVIWEGKRILMFAVDIRRKARKLRKDWSGLQLISEEFREGMNGMK